MKKPIRVHSDDRRYVSRSKRSPVKRSKRENANEQITHLKKKNKMIYIGIDAHKRFLQIAAMDQDGKRILNERVATDHDSLKKFFAQFTPLNTRCVMESSSVWYWLYRYLTDELGFDVVLSNPYQTKAIAESKKKTDKVDAWTLADLLRGNYISPCFVPSEYTVKLKQLVRHRDVIVKSRTKYKNLIHGILLQYGIKIPGSSFSKSFREELKKLEDYRIDNYLDMITCHEEMIRQLDIKMREEVKRSQDAQLLKTIPGVGNFVALVVISSIGDVKRFPTVRKICSYAGIVPSVRNSDGKQNHGHITRKGDKMLRWALTEAVHVHIKCEPHSYITKFHNRIKKRRAVSKATVATASKLLRLMYHMLIDRDDYVTHCSRNH